MGSAGFRLSCADNSGVVARGTDCTNVHLARLIAGVQKDGLDDHSIFLASESADVLGNEVSPANAYCSGTGKRISRIRSVARTVSLRCRTSGRAMELSQFLTHASSSHGRRIWFAESRGQLCVWSRELLVESYVFSAVIGVFAGLTFASVRMHRKRASHSRFVKDAASWPWRLVGPSVPGRVLFAPSRRRPFGVF